MSYAELILTEDLCSANEWNAIALAIAKVVKGVRPFSLIVAFEKNVIRYYIESPKDITGLSNALPGIVIKQCKQLPKAAETPQISEKIRLLRLPAGGNLIDVKEKYHVQEKKKLESIRIDVQKIGHKLLSKMTLNFTMGAVHYVAKQQLSFFPGHLLEIDFNANASYTRTSAPTYVNLEKTVHIMQNFEEDAVLEVDGFPYTTDPYYLHLGSYEFDKHSFIVGASGSGKSKFIELFIKRLESNIMLKPNYRVIVIDPHDSLRTDLETIADSHVVNFNSDTAQLFPDANSDIQAATELTTTLFKSLLKDQFNPQLERVMRFSIYVLLTSQNMSLQFLKQFLTDTDLRNRVLAHVEGYIPQNISQFFNTDFNEIRTQYYVQGIQPIVALVDEMQMTPSMVNETEMSLAQTIGNNFLTVFSLNKVSMGEKVVKTVAGLLIQQIFLLAQARVFNEKILLFIDEVSVVQNPALAQILSEARKYGLFVFLTQQYFGQVEEDLRNSIVSNVANYYVFRVSEEDAKALEGNIRIELPSDILERAKAKGIKEENLRVKLMTEMSPRECLVRISANGQMLPAFKAKTVFVDQAKSTGHIKLQKTPQAKAVPKKFDATKAASSESLLSLDGASARNAAPWVGEDSGTPSTKPIQAADPMPDFLQQDTSIGTEAEVQPAGYDPETADRGQAWPLSADGPAAAKAQQDSTRHRSLPKMGSMVMNAYSVAIKATNFTPMTMNLQELLASQSSAPAHVIKKGKTK